MVDDDPIRFMNAAEYRDRPRFVDRLDHQADRLVRIIGGYAFAKADEVECGLGDCRQKHQHGFVVAAASGNETNIGQDCGRRHLGVEFKELESRYRQRVEARETLEWLQAVVRDRDLLLDRCERALRALDEITAEIEALEARLCKEPVIERAAERVIRAGGVVQEERTVDADMARAMGQASSARSYLHTVARIEGVDLLTLGRGRLPSAEVAGRLRGQVRSGLHDLSGSTLEGMSASARKVLAKTLTEHKAALDDAERLVERGRRLLMPENRRLFGKLPLGQSNNRAKRILKQFQLGGETAATVLQASP